MDIAKAILLLRLLFADISSLVGEKIALDGIFPCISVFAINVSFIASSISTDHAVTEQLPVVMALVNKVRRVLT
jgi:hypothetical protein